jgi:hypothetical protein
MSIGRGHERMVKAKAVAIERPHYRSRLETRYAERLEMQRLASEIKDWRYEPFNIRLADGAWYRVDWAVVMPDDTIELHETKGWSKNVREGQLRWKLAAETLPWFVWRYVQWHAKEKRWVVRTYGE